jgi:hypothetical protein
MERMESGGRLEAGWRRKTDSIPHALSMLRGDRSERILLFSWSGPPGEGSRRLLGYPLMCRMQIKI